jgi:ABC-type polysaccharide/polyol phosphate export permease
MVAQAAQLWGRRDLISYLVACRIRSSVHRTLAGTAWYMLLPLTQMAIYYMLVAVIFRSEGLYETDPFVSITVGYLHYLVLFNTISTVVPSIYGSESILLQTRLDPLLLVVSSFVQTLRTSWFGIAIALGCWALVDPHVNPSLSAYPLVLLLWLTLCWIIGLLLATLAVFARDLQRLAPILAQIVLYASPVLYTTDFIPDSVRDWFLLNPIACIFGLFRWSLLGEEMPPAWAIVTMAGFLVVGFVVALRIYGRLRPRLTKAF